MKIRMICLLIFMLFNISLFAGPENNKPFVPDANMSRADIPSIYKWNVNDLCPGDEQWDKDIAVCQKDLKLLKSFHSDLATPAGIAKYMAAYFNLDERINRLTLYANLKRDVDATNQDAIARHELGLQLTEGLMREGATLRQTILGFSEQELESVLLKEPALNEFLPFINSLRRRADRVLSPAEERLLALAGDNLWAQIDLNELPSASEKVFRSLISELTLPMVLGPDNKKVQLSFSNYGLLRNSTDRNVRRGAVEAMFGVLKSLENTFATSLGEQAKFSLFLARARGYNTVLEAYLDKDDLDPKVYHNLVNTVRANVKPLHKYVELRKKVLNLDEVHLYDLYVPMVDQVSIELDYNNGTQLIQKALKPLGEDYMKQLKAAMDPANGWIDIYPSKDKVSGAFSSSTYGVHPYVKMNFQNTFDNVSTLAHEYGHAMHSYYSMTNQPYHSWRYVPFLAEIASTCNEALLSRYMIDHAGSDNEKAWLLSELLETIRTTIYRQALFAEFESRFHELAEAGEPITADKLNGIYAELIRAYYGPHYVMDENDHIEWAYIPHFYYKYYVFTYATGLSSGIAFAEKITNEGRKTRDAYLNMLKGGNSKPPLVLLRESGLDLTKPEAIESALKLFDQTVDELQTLLVK
ncbi:oligoendopeptidase F [candidate division KSB1 bacterium]|nr:oligoendopeptidase F [candidate division KSB1 bacterium]